MLEVSSVIDISEVYQNLRSNIFANRAVNVAPRTVINDFFIQPVATEISKQKILISFTSYLQSFSGIQTLLTNISFLNTVTEAFNTTIDNVYAIISTAVDNLAGNYNKTRKAALNSTGIINYYRPNAPASTELTNIISAGSVVKAINGMTYTTLTDVSYSNFYFDTNFNAFMLDVPAECSYAGTVGNTEQYTITTIQTSVSGWTSVTNKVAWINGTDIETDADFCNRCQTEISGSNIGTLNGIRNNILQNNPILDMSVVGAGDAEMVRDLGWGGKVDVYITDVSPQQVTWTYYSDGSAITYIQGARPIISTAAVSVTADVGYPVIGSIVADTTSPTEGSVNSLDAISWSVSPTAGSTVTLTYFVNKYINDVQTFIDQDGYNTGADILIKQALVVPVDIIFNISVFSGYSMSDIISAITIKIQNLLSTKKIYETLQQSDIIELAYTVQGLDRVIMPFTKFNRASLTGTVDVITTTKLEYLRPGIITIG